MGIPARAEIRNAAGARRHLDMGVRHFCVGWDVTVLSDYFTEQGKAMRDILSDVSEAKLPELAPVTSNY